MKYLIIFLLLSTPVLAEEVTRIIDGDTLVVDGKEKVRLIGIDTPERGECYFQEAKNMLTNLTLKKQVFLEKDTSDRGKYGRLVRYVYTDDLFINNELVKQGYAKAYPYYPDNRYVYLFEQSEAYAKRNNLGVWKACKLSWWERFLQYLNL